MQKLAGCVTSLGRFISKLGKCALPFFKLLKKKGPFEWTPEAEAAFQDLKRYLTSPPVMVAPHPLEPLKLLLALLVASRKLRHYFQGHPIKVVSVYPLEKLLHSPNAAGRVSNNIAEYEGLITGLRVAAALRVKCLTIKGHSQLLVNFSNKEYKPRDEHMEAYLEELVPRGTNKEADDIAKRASRREPRMPGVFEESLFKPSAAPLVVRPELLQEEPPLAPSSSALACGPTSGARLLLALEPQEGCWTQEFKAYLLCGTLPEKEEDAERVDRQATAYCLQDAELYRRCPNDISLRCISKEKGRELLADIHGRVCRHHSSSRTLMGKVFRSGLYWPTTLSDATELVRFCEACQFHAKQIHQPAQGL
ncbi:uncharacterized protein [Aegilops tauschii subsp. strangulata]|uniref:uncharacterized protein n=1 Tax=Aegilops tauschii subsp. strangulata TaxID=200361 RepID=UPI003CC874DA